MPWTGPGPNDGHLHDEVLEPRRAGLGKRLHLGAGLDLEDADRVGGLDRAEDLRVVVGQGIQVGPGTGVPFDPVQGVRDRAQGSQREEVDLHQAQGLDVLLVELGHDPARHGGPLDGDELGDRGPGHEHPADVDAEVARESRRSRRTGRAATATGSAAG